MLPTFHDGKGIHAYGRQAGYQRIPPTADRQQAEYQGIRISENKKNKRQRWGSRPISTHYLLFQFD